MEITYQQLRGLKTSAGAKANASIPVTGDRLELKASSGGQMELAVEVNALKASASEGAVIDIGGTTQTMEVSASTGGQFYGFELESERAYAKANTGGEIELHATQHLEANTNTGGSVEYKGEPEKKYTKSILGGDINKYEGGR